jgi:hypothetical protein
MTRITAAVIFFCLTACSPREETTIAASSLPDSIVLERTACLGTCPVYRLSLTKRGQIAFADNSGDATDSISPTVFAHLSEEFDRLAFASLPDTILGRKDYCTMAATDFPTAILTVFAGEKHKTVKDYHGCAGMTDSTKNLLRRLRLLENQVDSVTGASRWIKPSHWH